MVVPALLSACSGDSKPAADQKPTYPAQGSVLLDGKAVANAVVILHPIEERNEKLVRSYGRTAADGSFSLSTYKPGDGAPAGKYIVTIMVADADDENKSIPAQFAVPTTSNLRAEIREGDNIVPAFRLRRR